MRKTAVAFPKNKVSSGKILFLHYFSWIFLFCLTVEFALEYRHYNLGYTTPLLGSKTEDVIPPNEDLTGVKKAVRYGPTDDFPFRSVILPEKKTLPRVWIASASHAISNRIAPEKIFPNMICSVATCEVINGSIVGISIDGNINLLKMHTEQYRPDIAILYQMSMFVANESVRQATQDSVVTGVRNPLVDIEPLLAFFQRFSLYIHLNDLIGGNITLQGQLKDGFPSGSLSEFKSKLLMYITACRDNGIRPILSTFAASHDASNLDDMPILQKTNFVKWVRQPYLSPKGWVNTIIQLNDIIRTVAAEERVQLIDIATFLNGRPEKFVDFVHFNEAGHRMIAAVIAKVLFAKSSEEFE